MGTLEQCLKDHSKVERENITKWHHHLWKELYNCGKDVPEGISSVVSCGQTVFICGGGKGSGYLTIDFCAVESTDFGQR